MIKLIHYLSNNSKSKSSKNSNSSYDVFFKRLADDNFHMKFLKEAKVNYA